MILIQNGNIITGDGKTIIRNSSVFIENGIIEEILNQSHPTYSRADEVIDANNGYIIPGLINHHAHGITTGPFCPLGAKPVTLKRALGNLDRHLEYGTTSILNLDGLASISEVRYINKLHPIKIDTATQHTEKNFIHASIGDGEGIRKYHKDLHIETMVKLGVPAIGELFAMGPIYNIKKIESEIGTVIDISYMAAIKQAVLGNGMDVNSYDSNALRKILEKSGLDKYVEPDQMKDLIIRFVYDPWKAGYDALCESAEYAIKYDIPVIAHNSIETGEKLIEVSARLGNKLVASHSSAGYDDDPEKAVSVARKLKANGALIDMYSGDFHGVNSFKNNLNTYLTLFKEGLVDMLSTDYCAGHWDPMLKIMEMLVSKGILSIEKAVALATGNVVKAIPKFAYNSGLIEVNKNADIVILDKDSMSKVEYVLIDGVTCIEKGKRIYRKI
ncbi:MAG: 5'-deoxyadenosine deaminase [Candidatus Dichloromethanomonas elyunquensis]|nr:MAG: 5'-deoxyadenosine deaminase [Candidatus Dichloromethanomonas elyunquensis]